MKHADQWTARLLKEYVHISGMDFPQLEKFIQSIQVDAIASSLFFGFSEADAITASLLFIRNHDKITADLVNELGSRPINPGAPKL